MHADETAAPDPPTAAGFATHVPPIILAASVAICASVVETGVPAALPAWSIWAAFALIFAASYFPPHAGTLILHASVGSVASIVFVVPTFVDPT